MLLKGLRFHYIALFICLVFLIILKFQSYGVEGGMDSWQHFLISKLAIKHPELLLDQWNKPVFTLITVLIAQGGMDALIYFNILCVTLGAFLFALAANNAGFKNSWLIIPFTVFMPELFLNVISGLTEPLSLLLVAIFTWLWSKNNYRSALILAGFLPFVRTEGFVIDGAIVLLAIYDKQLRKLPWMLIGLLFMNTLGFAITGQLFWVITENPYWKHEVSGTFDPGSGNLFHFVHLARQMFGISLTILTVLGIGCLIFNVFKKRSVPSLILFAFCAFILYFSAHSLIYYLGVLGSHGLTRPMALLSPFIALLSFYAIQVILNAFKFAHPEKLQIVLALIVVFNAYRETKFPLPVQVNRVAIPFDKTQINFVKAGEWLKNNHLLDRVIVHQSPFFNCYFDKDPYDTKSSYYIWSIDQKNDWSNDFTIVVWDGFSAKREGNMPLEWLQNNSHFKEIHFIEGHEKPADDPQRYDIHIFEKVPLWLKSK